MQPALAPRTGVPNSAALRAAVPSSSASGAAAAARRRYVTAAAAAPAPPAPAPASLPPPAAGTGGGAAAAVGSTPSAWQPVDPAYGASPVANAWLAYSWQLGNGLPLGGLDSAYDRLRRQLGMGGRWAWQEEEEEDESGSSDWEADASDAEEGQQRKQPAAGSGAAESPLVASSRGAARRRVRGVRRCRGQALAGAAAYAGPTPWAAAADALPFDLEACSPAQLLTPEQEAQLGELVQAASSAAAQHLWQTHADPRPAAGRRLQGLLRQGAAAQQLLFDCNLRLVLHAQRQLLGRVSLPKGLHRELANAGRDALWRAAGAFQPSRHTRFSTYAVPAIMHALSDTVAELRCPVRVPREAQAVGDRVRRRLMAAAAAEAQQQQQRQQGQQAAVRPRPGQQTSPRPAAAQREQQRWQWEQQQQPGQMERLAAAAGVKPRAALTGLAAVRRQRVVSPSCRVPVEGAQGACMRSTLLLAPFWEATEAATEHDVLLASEVVEQLLSQLPAGEQRQARALRLRFRLEGAPAAAEGEGELLDYASVGRQLGVGRQRAQQLVSAGLARARQVATAAGLL